jgi:hypothetical protein
VEVVGVWMVKRAWEVAELGCAGVLVGVAEMLVVAC